MELKIKILDNIYEEIKNDSSISFDELHELFDAIRNGMPTTVSKNEIGELECILNKEEADIFNSLSNEQKEVVCKLLDNATRNGNSIEEVVSNGDCISRQAVLWYINRILNHGMGKKKSFEFIHKYVEKLPSITPQQKRGHWLYGELIPNDITGNWYAECSECGKVRIIDNYCPHCGSKNEG